MVDFVRKIIAVLVLLLLPAGAMAAMYKCKDAHGQAVFTDNSNHCYKQPPRETPAQASTPAPNSATPVSPSEPASDRRATIERLEAEDEPAPPTPANPARAARPSGVGFGVILGFGLFGIGVIISLVYNILFLVRSFQVSVWWGLGCLFLWPVAICFMILHWDRAREPFLRGLWAIPFLLASLLLLYPSPGKSYFPSRGRIEQGGEFHCEGKTRCPQMTSCDEAVYYLNHCPNVEMDGDNDGIPCEDQWCGH